MAAAQRGALGSPLTALGHLTGAPKEHRLSCSTLENLGAWGRGRGEGLGSGFLEGSPGDPEGQADGDPGNQRDQSFTHRPSPHPSPPHVARHPHLWPPGPTRLARRGWV